MECTLYRDCRKPLPAGITNMIDECNGSRDGAVVRVFASHQCGLGLILAWCHMWVEFVVGSRLGFYMDFLVFLPPQKPTSPNSNLTRIEDLHENHLT